MPHLLHDAIRCRAVRIDPRSARKIEHLGQAANAAAGMDAESGLPDHGDLAVRILVPVVAHGVSLAPTLAQGKTSRRDYFKRGVKSVSGLTCRQYAVIRRAQSSTSLIESSSHGVCM